MSRWVSRTIAVLALLGLETVAVQGTRAEEPSSPTFAQVERVVVEHFQAIADYCPGAIISRSQVEAVFRKLDRLGWPVADRNAILDQILSDDDWLVQELRTSEGRRFASRIAGFPEGYDRLDRLRRLAHGRRTVYDLIHGAGGYRMIEYMTRSPGGLELGKMLSKSPNGADFNRPTGRIYTVDGLLGQLKKEQLKKEQLKESHQAAQEPSQ